MELSLDRSGLSGAELPKLYEYRGSISRMVSIEILSEVEVALMARGFARWYTNRVCSVTVEMVGNLFRHAEFGPDDVAGVKVFPEGPPVTIILRQYDSRCMLETENYVSGGRKHRLQKRLSKINSASDEVLREQYLSVLSECLRDSSQKGGLGLLDISKKVARPLRYHFQSVENERWLYNLRVIINN